MSLSRSLLALAIISLSLSLCLATTIDPSASESLRGEFETFVQRFGKVYKSEAEKLKRFGIFVENWFHAKEAQSADPSAEYGVTVFSDLSRSEFAGKYLDSGLSRLPSMLHEKYSSKKAALLETTEAPDSVDWREHSPPVITPVKNQGGCGSCWSFSTTGNIEGQWALAGNNLTSLSEQNLVDCDHQCDPQDPQSCDAGCNGGLMTNAFEYVIKNGGIDTEASYPYEGVDDQCRFSTANIGAKISDFEVVSTDEDQIAAYTAAHGPLAVALNANWLQFYVGGVSDPVLCNPKSLDHGVLIVGYGKGKTLLGKEVDMWIVKNSWGASWGEKGFFMIKRGDGKCGINTAVSCAKV